jgi:hypothetical protein
MTNDILQQYVPHIGMMTAWGITEFSSVYCTGKIKRTQPFYVKQFEYLKGVVAAEVRYLSLYRALCSTVLL